ncbi:metal-dependent transcriptional regulator [Pelagicoccus sp. SDUM812003]|uniref:metal-dependent transcriptional regulator n=1 Tax=Pelagicoccus sp. SDUM812003 TaxID=3041267 RepID=UPI00280D6259|nr:metal-dependent transcriptional regulator [Pelagicoccus sp. SDUM812003]MDQ8205205.1 metal-dependent transcriptional regulator [Pelagicoccus sp. SDUM812003]
MATSTVENYIKNIYTLQFEQGQGDTVGMGELAACLKITPGTATTMVKSLAKTGLVSYVPRVGVQLTVEGEQLALLVLRRHRLVELFLVKVLGMEWHEIHDEAEALEHVISDRVLERIDTLLGRPKLDPHGDPIPTASGTIAERDLFPLADCELGQKVRIGRIENQEEAFLQYLENNDLTPGRDLEISLMDRQAGVISVRFEGGSESQLGLEAARKIQVEREDATP